ncbi:MAG: DUF3137 domain-containing protein [Bacteriovoracaceae bacterium]
MSFYQVEELKALYQDKLKYRLALLEKERMNVLWMALLCIACIVIAVAGFNLGVLGNIVPWIFAIMSVPFVCVFFYRYRTFKVRFKEKVVQEVINLIDTNWKYEHDNRIKDDVLYLANIFNRGDMDRIRGDDYIYGLWKNIPFQMSEVHIKKITEDSKGRKNESTIFHGLFTEIRFNKKIHSDTYIFSDRTEQFLGKFLGDFVQGLQMSRGDQVKLENPDFEKNFNCYSEDQVEARYIITPVFMEKLLTLKNKLNCPIHFSFKGDSVYVAVAYSRELLEAQVFKKYDTFEIIRTLYQELTTVCMIIEELKLNELLWTKS